MTRVSERQRYDSTNTRIGTARQLADDAQQTVLSGRKLRNVSDDPVSMMRALKNRHRIENIGQFRKNIEFARGFLSKTEESLLSMNEIMMRAVELGVQLANGSYDASARASTSEELRQLTEHAVGLGNSRYGNRYVFGGFQTSTPPVSSEGDYLGDDGMIFIKVDEDSFRPVNIPGREIFDVRPEKEGQEKSVIGSLRRMYFAMRDNNLDELRASLEDVNNGITKISNSMAILGARRSGIDDVAQRIDQTEETLNTDNNQLESADPLKSALDLRRAETALQSTLSAGAKILNPSLLNFLN